MEKKQNLTRHSVDADGISASISRTRNTMEIGVKAVTTRLDGLSLTGQTALEVAAKAVVLDPGRQEVCEGLRVAADCFAAIFDLAKGSGDTDLSIGSVRVTVPATGVTSSVHAVNWREAFLTACICRRRASLDMLGRFPRDILRNSVTKSDPVYETYIEALSALWLRADDTGQKLLAALKATEPANLTLMPPDYALNVITPEIEMAFRLADGNAAAFNESVRFAIRCHKAYWSKGTRKRDPIGYFALGPLALSSLAYDTGIAIEVESDYLPIALVEGECK